MKIHNLSTNKMSFILLVLLGFLGVISLNKVIQAIPITFLALLQLLTPLTTIFISVFFHKEKLTKEQWLGIGVAICALFLLNIGG